MIFSLLNLRKSHLQSVLLSGICISLFLLTACSDPADNQAQGDAGISSTLEAAKEIESSEKKSETEDTDQTTGNTETTSGDDVIEEEIAVAPQKEIVLCMGNKPESLYPYRNGPQTSETLGQAIYEPLITQVGYEYQPSGLDSLPSLANGDANIKKVMVEGGQRVVDNLGNIVSLLEDVTVINSAGEEVIFNGSPIEMEQMVVDFTLRPMVWSDGSPVSAEDSVYSFELASGEETAFRNSSLAHTASYEAVDAATVRWTGWPGFKDQTYFTNVWLPMPRQQDESLLTANLDEELTFPETRLSNGPYVIKEFGADGSIILEKNPNYYRQDEGYPIIDRMIVRFGNGEDFLAGEGPESCDVITSDVFNFGNLPLLEKTAQTDDWQIITAPGMVFEYIAFGVNPVSEYADRRPDWFEDPAVRQAMTMCTDREGMAQELTMGLGQVIHAYLSADSPLYPEDLTVWPYDPDQANALLDEAGYMDFAGDGRRQDISSGVPMTITLGTNSESPVRLGIAKMMKEDLAECGIPVETYDLTAGTWYAAGPVGRLFGRQFDLASLAWLSKMIPDCGLFSEANVSGPEEFGFGGWQNVNITGWSNEAYEQACNAARSSMAGGEGYEEAQQEALRIFAQELPAMPLFTNVKIAAVKSGIENVRLDSSQGSMLWNIYEWDVDR